MILPIITVCLCIVIPAAIALYCMAPGKRRDVSDFRGKRYAHRGLHSEKIPENSMAAFALAKEKGYGAELDVQMSADHRLVVFHDGTLKRMCGVEGNLKDRTWDELCKLRLKDTDERIPLLADVLLSLGDQTLICEIKSENGVKNYELCEKTYDLLKDYPGKWCIESFSPYLSGWFRKNHPEVIRGQLSCVMKDTGYGRAVNFLLTNLFLDFISRPDFIAYEYRDAKKSPGFRLIRRIFHPFVACYAPKGEAEIRKAEEDFDTLIFEEG